MKSTPTLFVLFLLFYHCAISQHRATIYGSPGVNEVTYKLIRTDDQHYVTAGRVNKQAALYKFDCAGNIVDSFRLNISNANHQFFDVLELPNHEFVAVGELEIAGVFQGLAMRFSADLQEQDFQVYFVFDRQASLRQIVRSDAGQVFLGGHVGGVDVDFANIFCATFDPISLTVQDSITEFTNGVDDLFSLTLCTDGNLLLTGTRRWGYLFDDEIETTKLAFIRKIKPDGTLLWDYERKAEYFKNKFGLSYFSDAIENESTGNILAVGNKFTGNTLTDVLDAHFLLLSPDGDSLDALTISMPGSQNLYQVIHSPNPDVPGFVAVGDSTPIVPFNRAAPLLVTVNEVNQKIVLVNAFTNQDGPITIRSMVQVSENPPRVAFAGIYYNPSGTGDNHDLYIATPFLEVEIVASGGTLTTVVQPAGSGYQYQWYTGGQPIPGATGPTFTPAISSEYTVVVTDLQECTGEQTYSHTVGTADISWLDAFRLFPNPNNGIFTLEMSGEAADDVEFSLFSPDGRLLRRETADFGSGSLLQNFDYGDLPPALYLLRIRAGEKMAFEKVVIYR